MEFKAVANNQDKYEAYKAWKRDRKLANDNKFYLESAHISYAILEDRTTAFLYYIGYIEKRKTDYQYNKTCSKAKKFWQDAYVNYVKKHPKDFKIKDDISKCCPYIGSMHGKIILIKAICDFIAEHKYYGQNTELKTYYANVKGFLQDKLDEMETLCDDVLDWCKIRNELVHQLFNRVTEEITERQNRYVENGVQLSDKFDNLAKKLKAKKFIRKSLGLSF